MLESLLVNPPAWYVVVAVAVVCLVVIAARIRSSRRQSAYLLASPSPDGAVSATGVDRIAGPAATVFFSIGIYLAVALFYSLLTPDLG